jgi:hypothetical protein|tara:strand:- start:501 stop:797 length:297 start_codon:yes stop_codon:yes gene_type:complete
VIYRSIGRETISDVSTPIGITDSLLPPTVLGVIYASVQAVGGNIRFTVNGTSPTTSLGERLLQDAVMEVWGSEDLKALLMIDDGGTATVEVRTAGGTV